MWRDARDGADRPENTEDEQGTGTLADMTGAPWEGQASFGEGRRLKIQQSSAHCPALYASICWWVAVPWGVKGGGGRGGKGGLGVMNGVMHVSYGTTTAD